MFAEFDADDKEAANRGGLTSSGVLNKLRLAAPSDGSHQRHHLPGNISERIFPRDLGAVPRS
jgi:hypothetical protein